ncbi:hypothetical protein TNIN_303121 [Trichonephila inaurata madagascariensis]|uniref:Uncharacterized protein n=1 Tax=Trichonephila inaurata madagascariensis TaxID=2747483 RepID=A0A8X6XF86_9ARAC|nr:hypothetical protein TNIN_303121 [Trichonephila inaurata madagascariensis]
MGGCHHVCHCIASGDAGTHHHFPLGLLEVLVSFGGVFGGSVFGRAVYCCYKYIMFVYCLCVYLGKADLPNKVLELPFVLLPQMRKMMTARSTDDRAESEEAGSEKDVPLVDPDSV